MQNTSRRDFLKGSLLAGAALGAAPLATLARATDPPGANMKFGLVTYQWGRDWDLPTLIANCTKAGVPGVELRVEHAHGVEPSLDAQQRREVKKRFADSPIEFVGMGTNQAYDSPDPDALAASIEATKAYIALSHDCGGSGVKVKPNSFHKGVPHEVTLEQIGKSLNKVAAFGADFGQQIRLEVHGTCRHLPDIRSILDVADHPNLGICWNSNDTDLEGAGLAANFNLVKDRLSATTHVRELDSPAYPFQQLLDLLVGVNYPGWILLEASSNPPDRVAALGRQRELFAEMLAKSQKAAG